MNVPNLPGMGTPLTVTDPATGHGHIHPDWYKYFTQLTNELQVNMSEEGTSIPQQNTANIAKIQNNIFTPRFIYDEQAQEPKVWVNGVFKTITTS